MADSVHNNNSYRFFQAQTGRLDSTIVVYSGQAPGPQHRAFFRFDSTGNRRLSVSFDGASVASSAQSVFQLSFSYYDAAERLRVFDKRACWYDQSTDACAATPQGPLSMTQESHFDQYYYDALGRRVLVRSRDNAMPCEQVKAYAWPSGCFGTIERTVADGL